MSGAVFTALTLMGMDAEAVWASWGVLVLSVVGPVVKKAGFFIGHAWDAWGVYKTTRKEDREPPAHYLKTAFKGGSVSLIEDILVHDPCYVLLMWLGQTVYPLAPVWLLAFVSFVVAVALVPLIEWLYTEMRFKRHLSLAMRHKFEMEPYYEIRFHISKEVDPDVILEDMSEAFKLRRQLTPIHYTNFYYDCNLPDFSGRKAEFRLRWRTDHQRGAGMVKTAQIIWTRASEYRGEVDQHRYFPIRKLKLYAMLKGTRPTSFGSIHDADVRWMANRVSTEKLLGEVRFVRMLAKSPNLLVSADISSDSDSYVVEIKTRQDIPLMIQAMRYLMRKYPVVQTTEGKMGLTE